MLDSAKQEFLIDHLARSAADFESAIKNADPADWNVRPAPDRWSVGEIAEHVMIIDARVAELSATIKDWPEEPYDANQSERKDQLILTIAEDRGTRIEAPPHVTPSGKLAKPEDFFPGFRKAQQSLSRLASDAPEFLRGRFREHPVLKKLDGYQWLLVCSCHRRRHLSQIEEVGSVLHSQ